MKWPMLLVLVRHDVSVYNALKKKKEKSPLYQKFLREWECDPSSKKTIELARAVCKEFDLGVGDAETSLENEEGFQAFQTGQKLRARMETPEVVFVSPYRRTILTLQHLVRGWPELGGVTVYEEERIREQEHGLALLHSDWRVFEALHPDQRKLYELEGQYWYRYPQGENVPDVRDRNRSWISTLVRDFAGKRVLAVTHHLNILATRANLERWGSQEFIEADKNEKPINCGVTTYIGRPELGKAGRLILGSYNLKLY